MTKEAQEAEKARKAKAIAVLSASDVVGCTVSTCLRFPVERWAMELLAPGVDLGRVQGVKVGVFFKTALEGGSVGTPKLS